MADVTKLLVVGSGQMGEGIAQVAAVAGIDAYVFDASAEALRRCAENHKKRLGSLVDKGKMKGEDRDAALKRLRYVETLEQASEAQFVVEAIVENLEVKRDLFRKLAMVFKGDQVLATNTSSISITDIAASIGKDAGRVIGMHFFNPVPVMELVEVIKGIQTAPETTERTLALATRMGKKPVPANDRPGFVSNRVLMPMINEAFFAWMEGVAEPKDIDAIMVMGCRFPMGPLRLADFIGLDTCLNILNVLHRELGDPKYRPCPLLKQLVTAGRLGDKTGRGVFEYPAK